ncbi:MAG TPA: DUF308 domain-containing protein [Nocardioidaceae bacterium]|nr:DUF308 domain-containing protein [Nocardioidaceae bacterium]
MAILVERTRTGWDIVIGALLIILGLVILTNAVVATKVSVLFLGWMLLIAGLLGLISVLVNLRHGISWSSAVAGGVLTVIGLMCLRHTDAAALTLTLLAGSLFLTTGLVRLIASVDDERHRIPLALGGAVSTILGLIVLFNLVDVSYAFLGVLLGIETISDGIAILLVGRVGFTLVGVPSTDVDSSGTAGSHQAT